jgi:RHS repeat-associated protein
MRKGIWLLGLLMLLCGIAHAQQGTVTYVYTDPQGTPLAEADAQGNITATFDYTPYGTIALGQSPNGTGYTGHVNDPETNLVYMQARYYDPATGRFISTDPLQPTSGNAFDFNRYAYVNNNPVNHLDPNGKCLEDACVGEAIAACAATPCGTAVMAAGASLIAIFTVRAVENTPGSTTQDSRSAPPPPLPEADGNPHSIPDGKGGYTTYPTGKATEGKQYRPTGKAHGEIPRPNVKEWKPNVSPDGTEHKGKGEVRPPKPEEVPANQPPPPPPPPKTEGGAQS